MDTVQEREGSIFNSIGLSPVFDTKYVEDEKMEIELQYLKVSPKRKAKTNGKIKKKREHLQMIKYAIASNLVVLLFIIANNI